MPLSVVSYEFDGLEAILISIREKSTDFNRICFIQSDDRLLENQNLIMRHDDGGMVMMMSANLKIMNCHFVWEICQL